MNDLYKGLKPLVISIMAFVNDIGGDLWGGFGLLKRDDLESSGNVRGGITLRYGKIALSEVSGPVAQMERAPDSKPRGRQFKSGQAHQPAE